MMFHLENYQTEIYDITKIKYFCSILLKNDFKIIEINFLLLINFIQHLLIFYFNI